MSRGGIEALLALMDEAFDGGGIEASNESQALLTNLASVPDEAWRALPVGASRSIESIALHVGSCKVMYDDYAFGADQTCRVFFDESSVRAGPHAGSAATSSRAAC